MANPLHQGQFFNVNAETGLAFVVVAIPLEQGQVFNSRVVYGVMVCHVAIPLKQGQVFNGVVCFSSSFSTDCEGYFQFLQTGKSCAREHCFDSGFSWMVLTASAGLRCVYFTASGSLGYGNAVFDAIRSAGLVQNLVRIAIPLSSFGYGWLTLKMSGTCTRSAPIFTACVSTPPTHGLRHKVRRSAMDGGHRHKAAQAR